MKATLGDLDTFNAVNMRGLMANLGPGDMMLSVNSCEICDGAVLSSSTVENYLGEQETACRNRGVLVRRMFRLGAAGLDGLLNRLLKEAHKIQADLLEPMLSHVSRGFDVTLHLCADPQSYNGRLDYIIVFEKGHPIAFITAAPANWEVDTDGKSMYSGVRTSDPVVVGILLEDRFPAREGGHIDLNTFCQGLIDRIDTTLANTTGDSAAANKKRTALSLARNTTLKIADAYKEQAQRAEGTRATNFAWVESKKQAPVQASTPVPTKSGMDSPGSSKAPTPGRTSPLPPNGDAE